ncbi:hypothetical protein BVC80_1211g23 [Macleaya cordata]|uniref:Zinc finger protein 830 n=1 Tax=Macleaya cordata TaxID=56857 RepID=A0A200Q3C3_MACCD|nr:hypothetical protein BVC80_1211g23 [Macleaya cordata]
MDAKAVKKALYRSKLKEAAQKRDKRIDSPLVRYNEFDQPVCRVCDVILKSESLWAAHQASRKHHEAIKNVKATAAGLTQTNDTKSDPPSEFTHKARSSSSLPADFFDKHDTKRQKSGLGTGSKTEFAAPKASSHLLDSGSAPEVSGRPGVSSRSQPTESFGSEKQRGESSHLQGVDSKGRREIKPVKGALPEGFFDKKDAETTRDMGSSGVKSLKRALPEGFFDNKDADTTTNLGDQEVQQLKGGALPDGFFDNKDNTHTTRKMDDLDAKQVKGALPEGFFDNKDADLRARGIQPVKIDIKDEYKEFEKLIQEDLHEVDERLEEEEIDAAEIREGEESLEQKVYRERVEMLKKKQMELKAKRLGGQKGAGVSKDSSDEESSSDEDDDEGNFAVDWRAKRF